MSEFERRCVELNAHIQDKTLSISERQAAAAELADAVKSVSRTDAAAAATAVSKLVDLGVMRDVLFAPPSFDIIAYVASGEVEGYANVDELFTFSHVRLGALFALYDGWGSHDHPEWYHRAHDAAYSTIPTVIAYAMQQLGDRADTAAVLNRAKVWGQTSAAAFCASGDATNMQVGAMASPAVFMIGLARSPAARREAADAFLDTSGVLEAITLRMQEAPVNSCDLYIATVSMALLSQHCMADANHTAQLFASGMLEACVGVVDRARESEVAPHVSVNRGIGQFAANVAATAEGRERLLATEGMEEALMWLLEHGGDPVGIVANSTLADPRGMAGLSLALLRGREEDAQLALPAKVVHQIVSMIDTYSDMGAATVLPVAHGLAELSVSDVNKQHLASIPAAIDSLHRNIGVESATAEDTNEQSLRTFSCSTLAQLAASDITLPLLLGHAVLTDLERVPSLPESSQDARNYAMAVLFAVQQHEKRAASASTGSLPKQSSTDDSWVMLSYEWGVQPTIMRIRDSLQRKKYRVWMDIDQMRGSVRSLRSKPIAVQMWTDYRSVPTIEFKYFAALDYGRDE